MGYRKVFIEKGRPVHIISRALMGVFKNKEDCYNFIFQFYATNLGKRGFNIRRNDILKAGKALLKGEQIPSKFVIKEHAPLVDLIDFSLVINHYHFYLIPNIENATSVLIGRLNNGFARFFNLIHNRKDALFGSRYKRVPVTTDFQSYAVSRYVSIINPLDIFQPGWREKGLKNWRQAFEFLKNFEFSSFPDRIGRRNTKILAPKEILGKYTFQVDSEKGREEFRKFSKEFLKERSRLSSPLYLE